LHNLTRGNLTVEEYKREFKKLLIKCDIQEPEEQTIVRYLAGLDPKYSKVVELKQYATFDEVTHKVEEQQKHKPIKHDFSKPPICTSPFNKGSLNFPLRSYPQNSSSLTPQRTQTPQNTQCTTAYTTTPTSTYPRTSPSISNE